MVLLVEHFGLPVAHSRFASYHSTRCYEALSAVAPDARHAQERLRLLDFRGRSLDVEARLLSLMAYTGFLLRAGLDEIDRRT